MKYPAAIIGFTLACHSVDTVNAQQRNPKKGLSLSANGKHECSAVEPHTDSSWWYSWGTSTGFGGPRIGNFCDESTQSPHPATVARNSGMDFVPMFWNNIPDVNSLSAEQIANMEAATHVMGYNEPERTDQANLTPEQAASMWGNMIHIANTYNLKIVGPCMTKDAFNWYDQWLTQCEAYYPGVGCEHDAICIHMYMQPHPCDPTNSWECIGDETAYHAKYHLNRWWNNYGNKPIWVTEYGCYPWAQGGCDAAKHSAIMNQLTGLFESPEYTNKIERYAYFNTYVNDPNDGFYSGALNVPEWEFMGSDIGCTGMIWVANTKPGFSWGIDVIGQCVTAARNSGGCAQPLRLSMDQDNCYCAPDDCTPYGTWGGMQTWREVTAGDSSTLSATGLQYNNLFAGTTLSPTTSPIKSPSLPPSKSKSPSSDPTVGPSSSPSQLPTKTPSKSPSHYPSTSPTNLPMPPVSTVEKYLCTRNYDGAAICADGVPTEGSDCLVQGTSCGNGGKVCQLAVCDESGPSPPPPTPTPPTPTPPTDAPPNQCDDCSTGLTNKADCNNCPTCKWSNRFGVCGPQ